MAGSGPSGAFFVCSLLTLLIIFSLTAPTLTLTLRGHRGGYVAFPKWYACINASLSFEFKTTVDYKQLLMYMDDGGTYDFIEVLLEQGGKLRVTLNIVDGRDGHVRMSFGNRLSDGQWHKVEIKRNRMETSVLVDNGETAKDWRLSYGSDFHFGLIDKNSLTYFGGMPTAMKANLHGMALPSAAFEPEFKGHIRNVIYGNCSCELVRAQYITGEGVSRPQDEACERRDPCGKGCICVSTDDGPTCDCSREECVQVLTHYELPMDLLYERGTLVNPSGLDAQAYNGPRLVAGIKNRAIKLEGLEDQYVLAAGQGHRQECFGDLNKCRNGYTLSMWVRFEDSGYDNNVYLSNGGHTDSSHGVAMMYKNGHLEFRFRKKDGNVWSVRSDNILQDRWYHLTATWKQDQGLRLYVNGEMVSRDNNPTIINAGAITNRFNEFFLGRANDNPLTGPGKVFFDEFNFWSKYKTAQEVHGLGPFYRYYLPMNSILGDQVTSTNVRATVYGNPQIVPGKLDNAIRLDGRRDYIDLGDQSETCLGDLERCIYGLSLSTFINFQDLRDNTYIMSSGNKGFDLYYKDGMLVAEFRRGNKMWKATWDNVSADRWYFLELSWHPEEGLSMYADLERVAYQQRYDVQEPIERDSNKFFLGRANTAMRTEKYASVLLDDMEIYYADRKRLLFHNFIQRGRPTKHMFYMDQKSGNRLLHPSIMVNLHGNPKLVPGRVGNALRLDGHNQYADLGEQGGSCFGNLDLCRHGVLLGMWMRPGDMKNNMYYLSSGLNGIKLNYENNMLQSTLSTTTQQWSLSTNQLRPNRWYYVEYSFHPDDGLKMYANNQLIGETIVAIPRELGDDFEYRGSMDKFYLGRPNIGVNNFRYGNVTLDEMEYWYAPRDYLIAHNYLQRGRPFRYHFDMDNIRNNRLVHPSLMIPVFNNPNVVQGKLNGAVRLDGNGQFIDLGEHQNTCFGNLDRCKHGITTGMWMNFKQFENDMYYLSNDGMKMYYRDGYLYVTADTPGKMWKTKVRDLQPNKWYFVEYTWHPESGLDLYVNNKLVDHANAQNVPEKERTNLASHFYVGRANTPQDGTRFKYADVAIDDMEVWLGRRDYLIANNFIQRASIPTMTIPFENQNGNKVEHPLYDITLHGGATLVTNGRIGKAVSLDGNGQYVDLGDKRGTCMGNIDNCEHGMTVQFYLNPKKLEDDSYVLSTDSYSVYARNGRLYASFRTPDKQCVTSTNAIAKDKWQHVGLSWDPKTGLAMYVNGEQVDVQTITRCESIERDEIRNTNVYIGRDTGNMRGKNYFDGLIDEVKYYYAPRDRLEAFGYLDTNEVDRDIITMDRIRGDVLEHPTRTIYVVGAPKTQRGFINNAVKFDGRRQYVDLGQNVTCQGNLQNCRKGFTLRFRMKPDQFRNNQYFVSSNPVNVYYQDGRLHSTFNTPDQSWTVSSSDAVEGAWNLVEVSWHPDNGLSMYVNGKKTSHLTSPSPRPDEDNRSKHFFIGRPSIDVTNGKYANGLIDDVQIWEARRTWLLANGYIDGTDSRPVPSTRGPPTTGGSGVLVIPRDSYININTDRLPDYYKNKNTRETFNIRFKTDKPNGLLWYTGNEDRNLYLHLKNSGLQLDADFGRGSQTQRIRIRPQNFRFNDDEWHHVVITRDGRQLYITVDGEHRFRHVLDNDLDFIHAGGDIYVGGSGNTKDLTDNDVKNNFEGSIDGVIITGDGMYRNLSIIDDVRAENRPDYIVIHGDLLVQTEPTGVPPTVTPPVRAKPITFVDPRSFIKLHKWDARKSGTISFKFRTVEPHGLILYNGGGQQGVQDFVAVELYDGKMYLVLDLGSGPIRTLISDRLVNDGRPHQVEIERKGMAITLKLDGETRRATLPGHRKNGSLDLGTFLYIGGYENPTVLPWKTWSRSGYVGCIYDLQINGATKDLIRFARDQGVRGVESRCLDMPEECYRQPCVHGMCYQHWSSHKCDCSNLPYTGDNCERDASIVTFDGDQFVKIKMLRPHPTHVNDMSLRFKTPIANNTLVSILSPLEDTYFRLLLEEGRLKLLTNLGDTQEPTVLTTGRNLNDNRWHTLYVRRRADHIEMWVDDGEHTIGDLPGDGYTLDVDTIFIAAHDRDPQPSDKFIGRMQNFFFDGQRFFEQLDSSKGPGSIGGRLPDVGGDTRLVFHDVTFRSKDAYLTLPGLFVPTTMNMSFMIKTRDEDGLIMYNPGRGNDFLAVELDSGYLKFIFDTGDGPNEIQVATPKKLNDNLWHNVVISRHRAKNFDVMVDDTVERFTIQDGGSKRFDLGRMLYIGGVPGDDWDSLPNTVMSKRGFQGCLASVDLNGRTPDLLREALTKSRFIVKGCGDIPQTFCYEDTCYNMGVCREEWNGYWCDCNMTSFVGQKCEQEANGFRFGENEEKGIVIYRHPINLQPDTTEDHLAFGFMTWREDGTIFRVDSGVQADYIEARVNNGHVEVLYDVGDGERIVTETRDKFNDGQYHVVRFIRKGTNATLYVDDYPANMQTPGGTAHRGVFDRQSAIKIGGNAARSGFMYDEFDGIVAGVYFNGFRIIDRTVKLPNTWTGDIAIAPHQFYLPRPVPPGPSTVVTATTIGGGVIIPPNKGKGEDGGDGDGKGGGGGGGGKPAVTPAPPVHIPDGKGGGGIAWKNTPNEAGMIVGMHPGGGGGGGAMGAPAGLAAAVAAGPAGGSAAGVPAGIVAGALLGSLLALSSIMWAFYQCKPGWCPCGPGGPAAGATSLKISSPARANTNYKLVKSQMASAGAGGGGAGSGAGTGTGVSAGSASAYANGSAGAGAGTGTAKSMNEYFNALSAVTSSSTVASNSAANGRAGAGGGAGSLYDADGNMADGVAVMMASSGEANVGSTVTETTVVDGQASGAGAGQAVVVAPSAPYAAGYGSNAMQQSSYMSSYTTESYSTTTEMNGVAGGGAGGAGTGVGVMNAQTNDLSAGSLTGGTGTMDYNNTVSSMGGMSSAMGGKASSLASSFSYQMQNMAGAGNGVATSSTTGMMASEEIKVDCCLVTGDGRFVVTGSSVGPPQVWDMRTGELVRIMAGEDIGSTDLHLACGDSLLVGQVNTETTLMDQSELQSGKRVPYRKLQIWDFVTGQPLDMGGGEMCSASCMMADGEKIVLGRTDKFGGGTTIVVWDLMGNEKIRELKYEASVGFGDSVSYLNLSKDNRFVIAGFHNTYDGNANFIIFDMSLNAYNIVEPKILALDANPECTAVIGNHEAVTGTRRGELTIWSMRTGKPLRQLISSSMGSSMNRMGSSSAAHTREINAVAVSSDGKHLVSASSDTQLKVWHIENEKLLHTLSGHADEVWCCGVSNDDDMIVSGSRDSTIRLWRMRSGSPISSFHAGVDVFTVKMSNDKRTIVALGDKFGERKLIMLQVVHSRHVTNY